MTEHKSFKRLVRARMAKTGESYTAARASLLRAEPSNGAGAPTLKTSPAGLPGARLSKRTVTRPKSARFDWADGPTRVHVTFLPRGESRSTVAVEHTRLPGAGEAERMKMYWRERLSVLKGALER